MTIKLTCKKWIHLNKVNQIPVSYILETVGEQSLELTSSPTVPICKKGRGYCQRTVWSSRQTSPVPEEGAIFCKRVSQSLGSCGELGLLGCLYPVLGQRQRWDVGGNPKEPERDSVKTKGPVRARAHKHFHTLFYLGKVFAATFLITCMPGEGDEVFYMMWTLQFIAVLLDDG